MVRYALVKERTIGCQAGSYFAHDNGAPLDCLNGGRYALVDLTLPTENSLPYFCVAHLCSEHALPVLTLSHDFDTIGGSDA